jgi:iron complex outermembrane receptor protein
MSKISNPHALRANVLHIAGALAVIFAAPAFAQSAANLPTVVVSAPSTMTAIETAPSQGSLEAHSAKSIVGDAYIRDYTSPVSDYTQVINMTPGIFSYTANGVGLGDAKITLRGLSDSNTVFSFDGIPFNDTNGVSHHSWVFFPAQFIGGAVVDRSPGSAATVGQATFGGSVDLQSRVLEAERRTSVTASYGSWNTSLIGLEHETGQFGQDGRSNLLVNVHEMKSDGYETYNQQDRKAASAKYQNALSKDMTLTLFASVLNLTNNTPNIKGLLRSDFDLGKYNYLLSNDPKRGDYYGYNFYTIDTDFEYAGIAANLGGGWKMEDKLYRYNYHNKQNYNGSTTTLSTTSAVDKLNSYITMGNLLRVSRDSSMGTLRMGLWLDRAESFRFQIPSDPRTWIDSKAPNFSETYTTTTMQPYVEHEFKLSPTLSVTPGVKYASYKQEFVHLQDNGGAVGPLGGVYNKTTGVITGGAASLANSVTYTDWLPSLDVHYKLQPNWSLYGQFAKGDQIPSTSVFDVKNALVSPVPKPTKSTTVQFGTVWNGTGLSLSADVYHTKLDGAYTGILDTVTGNTAYVLSGTQVNQGVELETNVTLGRGFSLYANVTLGSLKYANGKWVAGAPSDTESLGLNFQQGPWSANVQAKRVGKVYNDGKSASGVLNEAFAIEPVTVANLFVNYTVAKLTPFDKKTKLQFGVNNLFNRHDIVTVSGATGSSAVTPLAGDYLTILPERSFSLTATMDF